MWQNDSDDPLGGWLWGAKPLNVVPTPRILDDRIMGKSQEPVTIKKYANRRLYNTGTSTYVTLEDLANMVKDGEDFVVYDAKSGDDITHSVLTQIIFEQENKGQNLLPIAFLRQIIRFYGDSMQMLVPRYLEASISSFTKDQEKFRSQMSNTFTGKTFPGFEDHVRRNMEMFEKAFQIFIPVPKGDEAASNIVQDTPVSGVATADRSELDQLKQQMLDMQKLLNRLAAEPEAAPTQPEGGLKAKS